MDGVEHDVGSWNMLIAHPPCTYLSNAGARHLWKNHELQADRVMLGIQGRDLFMRFWWADIPKICVENPVPSKVFCLPKYTQTIEPYEYGHPYNIDLQYISVTNFDFTDTFTDAVEAKVKAQQEKEKAETDAEKRRVEAQATADADLIAANAEAEKSKVAADAELYVAEKKVEANRALNDSLNSNLLEYYRITNVDSLWNGELPTYVGGDGSIPIINSIN